MYKLISDIFFILSKSFKKSIYLFFILILLSAIFESLSIVIFFQAFKIFFSENAALIDENILANFFRMIGIPLNMENKFLIFPAIIVIYLIKNSYLTFFSWWRIRFTENIRKDIGSRLFSNYIFKDHTYHLNKNSSEFTRNIIGDNLLFKNTVNHTMILLCEIFIAICLAAVLIYLQPFLTISFILLLFLFLFISYFTVSRKLIHWGKKKQFFEGRVIKYLNESFRGHKEIKIFAAEKFFTKYFNLNMHGAAKATLLSGFFHELPRLWIEFFLILVFCFGFYYLISIQNLSLESVTPILAAYSGAALRLLPSFNRILVAVANVNSCKAIIKLFKKEIFEYEKFNINKSNQVTKLNFNNSIVFEDVLYSYMGEKKEIFSKFSLHVNKNQTIGIVGPSGSGKSTLVNLAMGLISPSKGKILIDDQLLNSSNSRVWQSKIGYVPQSIFLSDDSIVKNIAIGQEDEQIDLNKVKELISYCKLSSMVDSLNLNMDSKLGEFGAKISEGQKQRIGIARALYRDPLVLVLDEFSSSLDLNTENEIMKIIDNLKGKKTIFIVSHRKNPIKNCDTVIDLEKENKTKNIES